MADNVVGLRYVAEGYDQVMAGIKSYTQALQGVGSAERRAATGEAAKAVTDTARATEAASSTITRSIAKQDAEARRAYRDYLRYQREKDAAAQATARSVEQAAAQQARAQAAQAQQLERTTQSYQRLKAALDPAIAAQQRMREVQQTVRAAWEAGTITTREAAQTLRQYRAAAQEAAGGAQQMSLGLNRTGVIVQQAGYQIGDFLVQVQSGTNFMVALGQQATQLVGTFAAFATSVRTVALLSGLGIAIPLITAIGAAFMRTSGEAKTLADRVSDLTAISDSLGANLDRLADTELDQKFGDMTGIVQDLSREMVELDRAAEMRNLASVIEGLGKATAPGWLDELMDPAAWALDAATLLSRAIPGGGLLYDVPLGQMRQAAEQARAQEVFAERTGFQMGLAEFEGYVAGMKAAAQRGSRTDVLVEFRRFLGDATDMGAASEKVTDAGRNLADGMLRAALAAAETEARLNGSADKAKAAAEAEKERTKAAEEATKAALQWFDAQVKGQQEAQAAAAKLAADQRAYTDGLRDRLALQQAINVYGKDSAQVAAIQRAQHEALVLEKIRELDLTGKLADDAHRNAMALYDAEAAAAGLAAELKGAAAAMAALSGAGEGIEKKLAVAQARVAALKAGTDAAVAGTVAAERFELGQKAAQALQAGIRPDIVAAQLAPAYANLKTLEATLSEADRLQDAARKGGRGGRGGRSDPLADLVREQEQRRTLLGLSKEQRVEMEAIFAVQQKLGDAGEKLSAEQINALAQVNLELQRQEDLLKRQDQLAEQLGGTFGNLFIAATKGADSLRQALSNVLSNLAAMLANAAFTQLFKSAGGGFFGSLGSFARWLIPSANGNVFQGGSLVPFANGGVVSSPVLFPMTGGRTGLMGEAGPEAIMPLKRGSDGKLGVAAQSSRVEVVVQLAVPEGVTVEQTTAIAGNIAVQVMQAGLRRNQQALPRQLNTLDSRGTL